MQNLTEGPITRHVLVMALPMAIGMIVQTLYYLVDLYFVAELGDAAIAGVSAAGNAMFIVLALTQMLNVGTVTLVSHAVGRDDRSEANLVFNQSIGFAALFTVATLIIGYWVAGSYMNTLGADESTVAAGKTYLYWFIPCLALQFAPAVMMAALRGTGIVKPAMIIQLLTVVVNIILAPILIAGWGTGYAMGVAGAGLASSLALLAGVLALTFYFIKIEKYVFFDMRLIKPKLAIWRRLLAIGFPAGGEFLLMFVYMAVIYWTIQGFGVSAQAGFGVGGRIMQAIFLPAMAIAFAVPAVAGQNFGANLHGRVRESFKVSVLMCSAVMFLLTLFCQWRPEWFMQVFTQEAEVIAVGADFLRIISWNFVTAGIVFTCSGMFQALGNTWPSLLSSGTRLLTFAIPAVWLSQQSDFKIEFIWYLSVTTVVMQAILSLFLVRWQFRLHLKKDSVGMA